MSIEKRRDAALSDDGDHWSDGLEWVALGFMFDRDPEGCARSGCVSLLITPIAGLALFITVQTESVVPLVAGGIAVIGAAVWFYRNF